MGKGEVVKNQGKDWPQVLSILSATTSMITYGLQFSWPSPSIPRLIDAGSGYGINLEQASYFSVIPPITAIAFSPIFGRLIDAIGRKPTILLVAAPHLAAFALIAFTGSIWTLYLSRFFTGIGDGLLFTSVPVYISEISTPKVRGSWGNAMTSAIYVGQLLITLIGGHASIKAAAAISGVFPVLFACTFVFAPESPYYQLMKGRREDARVCLRKLRGREDVEEELQQIGRDVQRQIAESGTWGDLFAIAGNRKALLTGLFLRVSQQLSGIPAFFVYTQYFFEKAGGDLSAVDSSTIFYAVLVASNALASYSLDKIGRRRAMVISLLICSLALFSEMGYFLAIEGRPDVDVSAFSWLPVAGLVVFIAAFQVGIGIVPTLMLGELFSQNVKGKGLCVLNVVMNVCVCVMTKLFQVLQSRYGLQVPFALFACCSLVNAVLAGFLVPETGGKTLEEIQLDMRKGAGEGEAKGRF